MNFTEVIGDRAAHLSNLVSAFMARDEPSDVEDLAAVGDVTILRSVMFCELIEGEHLHFIGSWAGCDC